jgi:hypothetical protein
MTNNRLVKYCDCIINYYYYYYYYIGNVRHA